MNFIEVLVGNSVLLYIDNNFITSINTSETSDEIEDMFSEIRNGLESLTGGPSTVLDCRKMFKTDDWTLDELSVHVSRFINQLGWEIEDAKYWYAKNFNRNGLALFEIKLNIVNETDDVLKNYTINVIEDIEGLHDAIDIAIFKTNKNVIINDKETIKVHSAFKLEE